MAKKSKSKQIQQNQEKMKKERIAKATKWVAGYSGDNIVGDYSKEFAVDIYRATKDLQTLGCDLSGIDIPHLILDENAKQDFLLKQNSISTMLAEAPDKISEGLCWLEETEKYLAKRNLGPVDLEEYKRMAERYRLRIAQVEAKVYVTTKKLEEPNPDICELQTKLEKELDCLEKAKGIAFCAMQYADCGFGSFKLLEKKRSAYLSSTAQNLSKEAEDDYSWFDFLDYKKALSSSNPDIRARASRDIVKYSKENVVFL